MNSHKDHTCLVWDNGLFVPLAVTLAKEFGKTFYYSPWEGQFPKDSESAIGAGLPGVTRANDPWKVIEESDPSELLIVFPDSCFGGVQHHLRGLGYRVWGSGLGEDLEMDRLKSKELMAGLGIPIGEYKHIVGMEPLMDFLKENEDYFVKARYGRIRGVFETFRCENFQLAESRLREIESALGTRTITTEFLVEKPIEPAVEIGYDGYSVLGQFPGAACLGIEVKGDGYVGHFMSEEDMPEQAKGINQALAPYLKEHDYRNFFAVEARIDKQGIPWAIDPCCRCGRPPSELLQVLYTNIADILWQGGEGVCIDPIPADEWGAELMIYCERAERFGAELQFPDEISDFVKLSDACKVKGRHMVVPGISGIGAVVATGSTMKEATELCIKRAKEVKGYGIEINFGAMDKAKEAFEELKKHGVDLG